MLLLQQNGWVMHPETIDFEPIMLSMKISRTNHMSIMCPLLKIY